MALTVSEIGVPLKLGIGIKRISVLEERARALPPSVTLPIGNQLPPLLVEYCQTPLVDGFAALLTTAIPARDGVARPVIAVSLYFPLKMVAIVAPWGVVPSSGAEDRLPDPRVGA